MRPGPVKQTFPRPFVQLNCAISMDGRLAYAHGVRARLSSKEDLRRVQALRASSDAILVGAGTIVADDPSLRVHWELLDGKPGPEPIRVILDSAGRVPEGARVLDGSQPTIVATTDRSTREYPPHVTRLIAGVTRVDVELLLRDLAGRGIRRLLVEGGARVFRSFLELAAFDLWTIYVAPVVIGGSTAPSLVGGDDPTAAAPLGELQLTSVERLDPGFLVSCVPGHASPPSKESATSSLTERTVMSESGSDRREGGSP